MKSKSANNLTLHVLKQLCARKLGFALYKKTVGDVVVALNNEYSLKTLSFDPRTCRLINECAARHTKKIRKAMLVYGQGLFVFCSGATTDTVPFRPKHQTQTSVAVDACRLEIFAMKDTLEAADIHIAIITITPSNKRERAKLETLPFYAGLDAGENCVFWIYGETIGALPREFCRFRFGNFAFEFRPNENDKRFHKEVAAGFAIPDGADFLDVPFFSTAPVLKAEAQAQGDLAVLHGPRQKTPVPKEKSPDRSRIVAAGAGKDKRKAEREQRIGKEKKQKRSAPSAAESTQSFLEINAFIEAFRGLAMSDEHMKTLNYLDYKPQEYAHTADGTQKALLALLPYFSKDTTLVSLPTNVRPFNTAKEALAGITAHFRIFSDAVDMKSTLSTMKQQFAAVENGYVDYSKRVADAEKASEKAAEKLLELEKAGGVSQEDAKQCFTAVQQYDELKVVFDIFTRRREGLLSDIKKLEEDVSKIDGTLRGTDPSRYFALMELFAELRRNLERHMQTRIAAIHQQYADIFTEIFSDTIDLTDERFKVFLKDTWFRVHAPKEISVLLDEFGKPEPRMIFGQLQLPADSDPYTCVLPAVARIGNDRAKKRIFLEILQEVRQKGYKACFDVLSGPYEGRPTFAQVKDIFVSMYSGTTIVVPPIHSDRSNVVELFEKELTPYGPVSDKLYYEETDRRDIVIQTNSGKLQASLQSIVIDRFINFGIEIVVVPKTAMWARADYQVLSSAGFAPFSNRSGSVSYQYKEIVNDSQRRAAAENWFKIMENEKTRSLRSFAFRFPISNDRAVLTQADTI